MSNGRNVFIGILLVLLALIGGGIVLLLLRPKPTEVAVNPPLPTVTPAPTLTPVPMLIYVTGEVANPQTRVSVPHGSRVQDVVEAAGGATENADLDRVNLAAIVRDGDQVHVPSLNGDDQGDSADNVVTVATPSGGTKIRVNSATVEELESLPGIGPALAQRIIDYRTENGDFATLADLDNVSGIGESILSRISNLIAFD